jgi:hypothetical protein
MAFCEYFSNIGPSLSKNIPSVSSDPSFYFSGEFNESFVIDPVTDKEIRQITKEFQSGKATGYDNIPFSIVKDSIDQIDKPLAFIINLSLSQGIFPDQMKISRITPLYKSGDKSQFCNYRPISILPTFSTFRKSIL